MLNASHRFVSSPSVFFRWYRHNRFLPHCDRDDRDAVGLAISSAAVKREMQRACQNFVILADVARVS